MGTFKFLYFLSTANIWLYPFLTKIVLVKRSVSLYHSFIFGVILVFVCVVIAIYFHVEQIELLSPSLCSVYLACSFTVVAHLTFSFDFVFFLIS